MNILYIGCVESSYIELELLLKNGKEIVGVITKQKSDFNADFVDLKSLCDQYGVNCKYIKNINSEEAKAFIQNCNPDVIYCFGWSQLIKKEILEIPRLGVVGTHPAELPKNRGRHPIIWALALGLKETASTFFFMDEAADSGDIISQRKIEIKYTDYAEDLYRKITQVECEQILEFTHELENNSIVLKKQKLEVGNVWRKRGLEDGIIDWRMSSRAIYNLVRALSRPYVGAQFKVGDEFIKVWRVEEIETNEYSNIEPGKIVKYISKTDYFVKAYDNLIHILEGDELDAKEGDYL